MGRLGYGWGNTFTSIEYQNSWRCIVCNTFEHMELYYRKRLSKQELFSAFEKAFTMPESAIVAGGASNVYEYKLLAIYLLTKYSKEDFKIIADEFNISLETVNLIHSNNTFKTNYQDDIKLFFDQFASSFLTKKKESMEWKYFWEGPLLRQSNVEEDIM